MSVSKVSYLRFLIQPDTLLCPIGYRVSLPVKYVAAACPFEPMKVIGLSIINRYPTVKFHYEVTGIIKFANSLDGL